MLARQLLRLGGDPLTVATHDLELISSRLALVDVELQYFVYGLGCRCIECMAVSRIVIRENGSQLVAIS